MFFCYFGGLEFFLRLETQCGGWPSLLLKERGPAIVMHFRGRDSITGARLYLYEPRPPIFYTKFDKIYYIRLCDCFFNSSLPLSDEQT